MPRVRWRLVSVMCLFLSIFWIVPAARSDCWFENVKYQGGDQVPTVEPCLNCTCKQGALICYLRICAELPDPPPPGCIILHRHHSCCPELICADFSSGNGIEARSEPGGDETDISLDPDLKSGCIENGTVYGPGSAMGSSSACRYCYCIGGQQTCIKPRCLLNLDGCTPIFATGSCCPVRYNCTGYHTLSGVTSTSTTTETPKHVIVSGGCLVADTHYAEGSRILGVGHSVCDNCYCFRGMLRCEPLSCAPPILGCTPMVKTGECCASSYNCNGTIEIQPEPNYGQYPTISKEYSKLRKEVQQRRPSHPSKFDKRIDSPNSNSTYYVLAESSQTLTTKHHRSSSTSGTTRHIIDPSTKGPFYYNTMSSVKTTGSIDPDSIIDIRTRPSTNYRRNFSSPTIFYGTTNYQFQNTHYKRPFYTTTIPRVMETSTKNVVNSITLQDQTTPKQLRSSDYKDRISDEELLSFMDALFDNEIKMETNASNTNNSLKNQTNLESLTDKIVNTTQEDHTVNLTDVLSTLLFTLVNEKENEFNSTTNFPDETISTTTDAQTTEVTTEILEKEEELKRTIYSTSIVTTTDCITTNNTNITDSVQEKNQTIMFDLSVTEINEINNELEGRTSTFTMDTDGTEETLSTLLTTTERDITEVDLESRVRVATITHYPEKKVSEIEAIPNIAISKNKDYDEYDYNEPTLPPSLPNLRIIPFVAADALDAKKHKQDNTAYSLARERMTDLPPFSLFSPPTKTEGGFVPKDLPVLHDYFDIGYRTTRVDITSGTPPLSVPVITNSVKGHKYSCLVDGREVQHGERVSAETCTICVCFYENVVCQQPQCSPPAPGCIISSKPEKESCCPPLICDSQEAPTVVLDRMDVTSNSQEIITVGDGMATPDPFRDVIRTEPAPDLQSLIGDIMPYWAYQSSTQKMTTESTITTAETVNSTTTGHANATIEHDDDEISLNKVLELLFYGEVQTERLKETTMQTAETPSPPHTTSAGSHHPNSVDSTMGAGLLKLAGCNIYGRMYRVGRIISELSGPCIECKCTEVGVQCTPLKC